MIYGQPPFQRLTMYQKVKGIPVLAYTLTLQDMRYRLCSQAQLEIRPVLQLLVIRRVLQRKKHI